MRRLYRFFLAPALVATALPAAAQTLIATVPIGINPSQVAGNTTTNTIYVANSCGTDPACGRNSPGTVTVIDGATNTVTATVTVGLFPLFLVVNPVTNKIYVTNYNSNSVSVIDGTTNTVTTTIAVGANPNGAAVNSITNNIYVANSGDGQGNTMSVIDGNTDTVSATVMVGNFPGPVAVNPVTNMVYVTNYCGNQPGCKQNPAPGTVSVIDGATNTVTNTVTVGDGPFLLLVNQVTNQIWVQNTCGNDPQCEVNGNSNVNGTVTQIDGATLATSSANTGKGSASIAINTVTNQVYVSNNTDNTETFIDGVTLSTTTVNVGTAPTDVEVNPVTDKIYVCDFGSNMVTVIGGVTLATTTVGVGNGPNDAWVSPITNRVYVSNLNDSTLSVLAGAQLATTTTLKSRPNPSTYLAPVMIMATVVSAGDPNPTGTVDFTDSGGAIMGCTGVALKMVQGTNNTSVATCSTTLLAVGTHSDIVGTYAGNGTFNGSAGTDKPAQVVNQAPTSLGIIANPPSPSRFGQPVTFTATVTSSSGVPSGVVTFTSNSMPIAGCSKVMTVNGVATCTTKSLACGSNTILASFDDPRGDYANSSGTLTQTVQGCGGDFEILPIMPSSITVTQSNSNMTAPFFSQTVQVTVQALSGYSGTVSLKCSISPPLTGGSCVVSGTNPGTIQAMPSGPPSSFTAMLTVNAGASSPIGNYTIIVTGQDQTGLMQQAGQNLTVIQYGPGVKMCPGCAGPPIPIYFPGPPSNPITPSCTLVNGTGLTGNQPVSMIGGVCTFSPPTGTGPFMLVISGCEVARLHQHVPVYASFFLGLPGVVLLGSLAGGRSRRRKLPQIVGLLMLVGAMLWAVGCGGYGQLTPPGNYQVLVQGTGSDGTVYSAVVPVLVTPLN